MGMMFEASRTKVCLCASTQAFFGSVNLRSFESGQAKFLPEIFILFPGISGLVCYCLKISSELTYSGHTNTRNRLVN